MTNVDGQLKQKWNTIGDLLIEKLAANHSSRRSEKRKASPDPRGRRGPRRRALSPLKKLFWDHVERSWVRDLGDHQNLAQVHSKGRCLTAG